MTRKFVKRSILKKKKIKKLEELSTTSVTTYAKETFVGGKEKSTTRNKKTMTQKSSLVKANMQ